MKIYIATYKVMLNGRHVCDYEREIFTECLKYAKDYAEIYKSTLPRIERMPGAIFILAKVKEQPSIF